MRIFNRIGKAFDELFGVRLIEIESRSDDMVVVKSRGVTIDEFYVGEADKRGVVFFVFRNKDDAESKSPGKCLAMMSFRYKDFDIREFSRWKAARDIGIHKFTKWSFNGIYYHENVSDLKILPNLKYKILSDSDIRVKASIKKGVFFQRVNDQNDYYEDEFFEV